MSSLANIQHIVVVMLENRSFDCMLGNLYQPSPGFDGLTGSEFNLDAAGNKVCVWHSTGTDPSTMSVPDPDPGELWLDINEQLFGRPDPQGLAPVPDMSGFVTNYMKQPPVPGSTYNPKHVMHYFLPEQVPILSQLARQFAVCDRWFASAPCQTWPNRFFVHAATADGRQNNSPAHFPSVETIYDRFELAGNLDWKIYFHDIPQSKALTNLWVRPGRFHFFNQFKEDAAAGTLPAYSFIEPRYFADWSLPNDQHPPHDATLGEQLIADVYNAVRGGKGWLNTLLIVTYDEHGGCYDHVAPPAAKPPGPAVTTPFNFDRYGVRVPAVLVSPYIRQATVLRPPGDVPFDHTSIIATLRKRFAQLGPPLTARDAVAPDLESVLALTSPDNLGPPQVTANPYTPEPAQVAKMQSAAPNDMQHALIKLAANLPQGAGTAAATNNLLKVRGQAAGLKANTIEAPHDANASVLGGAAFIKSQLGRFFS